VTRLVPLTPAGEEWLAENVRAESWQWFGGLCVEPRYAAAIVEGARAGGLEVA
jgi:hypothetical protein